MKFMADGLFSAAMMLMISTGSPGSCEHSSKLRNNAAKKLMPEHKVPTLIARWPRVCNKRVTVSPMDLFASEGRPCKTGSNQALQAPMGADRCVFPASGLIAVCPKTYCPVRGRAGWIVS